MKIVVITAWGDEHTIAPYFLQHYAFADDVIVLMGPGISAETVAVCDQFPNAQIREVAYPGDKWDMYVKQDAMTRTAHTEDCDWAIVADADEFVFPMRHGMPMADPRPFLEDVKGNVINAFLWHVYRNVEDQDLNPKIAPLYQRGHGDPEFEHHYIKPIVVRPGSSRIKWHIGAHRFFENDSIWVSEDRFYGVHWHWADVDMAIERHNMVKSRIIEPQKWLTDAADEKMIRARCDMHRNDPRLF